MLKEDLTRLRGDADTYSELDELQEEIVDHILPISTADARNGCTLEIMQAAGGSESSLFAEEILNMYRNYSRRQGYRFKEENVQKDMAIGKGCKYALCIMEGENVFKFMKHESGVHKV